MPKQNGDAEGEVTTVAFAQSKSRSLRATIPTGIAKQFNLDAGDQLDWKIKVIDGGLAIVVKPLKEENKGRR